MRRGAWGWGGWLCLAMLLGAGGCRKRGGEIPTLRRIPFAAPVSARATLTVDGGGRLWVGDSLRVMSIDTMGRVTASLPVPAGAVPRVLRVGGGRVTVSRGPRTLTVIDAATGRVLHDRRSRLDAPVALEPRGRWAYTVKAGGGVLGLDSALAMKWGWPEGGSRSGALAVSPLGDRVYLALDGSDERDLDPTVQTRDAFSGRVLGAWVAPAPVRGLEPGADGRIAGWDADAVFLLRHAEAGVEEAWRVSLGKLGLKRIDGVRVAPDGGHVAVIARGEGGGVRVLDAADGRVVAREDEAPTDAAWDVRGRLLVLRAREIRVAR
ncbi:MAG TPA: PQQ-binding-like beta-propeller repeat protein [Longimicrobium sp.]